MIQIPENARILFVQRSLPPVRSASGWLVYEFAKELNNLGFRPMLLGTRPDRGIPDREVSEGVEIFRVLSPEVAGTGGFGRIVGLLQTHFKMWSALWKIPRPDLLVTWTDPPLSVCPGNAAAGIQRIPHVHWSQDLYPETALAGGVMRAANPIYRLFLGMSLAARRSSGLLLSIGRCMSSKLGAPSVLFPNWGRLPEQGDGEDFRRRYVRDNRLLVFYSGNLGRVHDFSFVEELALRMRNKRVDFLFAGDGAEVESVRAVASEIGNVRLLPPFSWSEYVNAMRGADVHLVTLKKEFEGFVVPSKFYEAAVSGRPVMFVGPEQSECAIAIRETGCGWTFRNGDVDGISSLLEKMTEDRKALAAAGSNGIAAFARRTTAQAAREWLRLVGSSCSPPGKRPAERPNRA